MRQGGTEGRRRRRGLGNMGCVLTPTSGQRRRSCSPAFRAAIGQSRADGFVRSEPVGHDLLRCPSVVASTASPYSPGPAASSFPPVAWPRMGRKNGFGWCEYPSHFPLPAALHPPFIRSEIGRAALTPLGRGTAAGEHCAHPFHIPQRTPSPFSTTCRPPPSAHTLRNRPRPPWLRSGGG